MAVKQTAGCDSLGTFAPEFAHLNDDILFGEVWSREEKLSLRNRSLVTVVSLMSQGSAMEHFRAKGDADKSGLDAVTSASVVVPENTAMIAQWIKEQNGADTFSIVAKEACPSDYNDCMDRAYREKSRRMRPQLKTHILNFDDYDVIYLGFPNWQSNLPMPVLTFLEEYDFAGKTVIPFCAHGTSGIEAILRELKSALPKSATVLEPIGVYRAELLQSKEKVQRWVLKTTK